MTDCDAFIQTIAQNVYDDAPRLVFADWLDEHGEEALAEFIRVQVELEPIRDLYEIPRAAELHTRENVLLADNQTTWLANLPDGCKGHQAWEVGVNLDFRRGFPDRLRCSAKAFIQYGPEIRSQYPTIRRTVIHCLNGWGQRLSECKGLEGLAELELACWYSLDDIKALASSEYFSKLQVLVLWMGHLIGPLRENRLCQLAVEAKAWSTLREIVVFDPEGYEKRRLEKLVEKTNKNVGWKVARYQRGYPELFPLNRDFYYDKLIAGHLPNGSAAVLYYGPYDPAPTDLIIQTFDSKGNSTEEQIRIPIPPELQGKRSDNFDGKYTQIACDAVGFVPSFIRVQEYALSDDIGPDRGHGHAWTTCGAEDDPEKPENYHSHPDANGHGGEIYWLIDSGQFTIRHDCWADKTGHIHST